MSILTEIANNRKIIENYYTEYENFHDFKINPNISSRVAQYGLKGCAIVYWQFNGECIRCKLKSGLQHFQLAHIKARPMAINKSNALKKGKKPILLQQQQTIANFHDNLMLACGTCNLKQGKRDIEVFLGKELYNAMLEKKKNLPTKEELINTIILLAEQEKEYNSLGGDYELTQTSIYYTVEHQARAKGYYAG